MYYKITHTLLLIVLSLNIFSQTKKIAFKSHSGNTANYYASANTIFESESSNFGLGPTHRYFVDSITILNDSSIIIARSAQLLYTIDTLPKEIIIDTLTNFFRFREIADLNNTDSVIEAISNSYAFENSIDSIKIIKIINVASETPKPTEKPQKKEEKKEDQEVIFPVSGPPNDSNNNNGGPTMLMLTGLLLVVSTLLGLAVKMFTKKEVITAYPVG